MQVVVNDLVTNCELSGTGSRVLLLHGWGDSIRGLHQLQTDLAEHFQVLAIDLPGFGSTEVPKSVWNLDDYGDFIAAVLKKLEFQQPYSVIGHSNGGAVAIRAIALNSLKPEKLVLIAASGIRPPRQAKRLFFAVLAKVGNAATIWMPERYRSALRKSLYKAAGSDMLVAPQLQETFKKTVRQDVQDDARTITVPTLLIFADNDPAVPSNSGQRYNELIKNSELKVIENAGHFIHIDQAEKVNELIEGFLG